MSKPSTLTRVGKTGVLGSADFDVNEVDVSTLSFAGLGVRVKVNGAPQCALEDVSGGFAFAEGAPHGFPDLVCQFVDDPDTWNPGDDTATLTGFLNDSAPIEAADEICIVP
jgi:hypothetical protein